MITFEKLGRYGRLGNQMFQIASTIGIAKANGYDYAFPEWVNHDAAERFGSKEDVNVGKWFPNWEHVPRLDRELPEHYVGEMGQLGWGWQGFGHPDNMSYVGHMQTERYFAHCADYIRELFTMRKQLKKEDHTAVHVRCGDYGSDYHPICAKEYYEQAFALVPGPYLIFSDDIDKAMELIPNSLSVPFYGHTESALRNMIACRRHIIANSTFSWWGAWLAESDQVVAPKQWFGPAASHLDTSDIYCDGWVVI
jgi:hypothetical protein